MWRRHRPPVQTQRTWGHRHKVQVTTTDEHWEQVGVGAATQQGTYTPACSKRRTRWRQAADVWSSWQPQLYGDSKWATHHTTQSAASHTQQATHNRTHSNRHTCFVNHRAQHHKCAIHPPHLRTLGSPSHSSPRPPSHSSPAQATSPAPPSHTRTAGVSAWVLEAAHRLWQCRPGSRSRVQRWHRLRCHHRLHRGAHGVAPLTRSSQSCRRGRAWCHVFRAWHHSHHHGPPQQLPHRHSAHATWYYQASSSLPLARQPLHHHHHLDARA